MERVVRAVPVKSQEALKELATKVEQRPNSEKKRFLEYFGNAVEEWYYQEIEGKPYIIAIAEGERLGEGFDQYPNLDDPFFNWFRGQVLELSGIDLREIPRAAESELIFKLSA